MEKQTQIDSASSHTSLSSKEIETKVKVEVEKIKLKLKKENIDLNNSMLKKFAEEKEKLRAELTQQALTAEIEENIQKLLEENQSLKDQLKDAQTKQA
mmetsp:Transcript_8799/g.6542  ORF Transcript_8799/g.6542 Transcript_8799/m.6542 type:complete len:98 (+) Transcript_8799:487-780(+)